MSADIFPRLVPDFLYMYVFLLIFINKQRTSMGKMRKVPKSLKSRGKFLKHVILTKCKLYYLAYYENCIKADLAAFPTESR